MSVPLGSVLSVVSKLEVRYEGELVAFDAANQTVTLRAVRVFGTEDRPLPAGRVRIPPSSDVFDSVVFSGGDIKNIEVRQVAAPAAVVAPPVAAPAKPPTTTTTTANNNNNGGVLHNVIRSVFDEPVVGLRDATPDVLEAGAARKLAQDGVVVAPPRRAQPPPQPAKHRAPPPGLGAGPASVGTDFDFEAANARFEKPSVAFAASSTSSGEPKPKPSTVFTDNFSSGGNGGGGRAQQAPQYATPLRGGENAARRC